MSEFDDDLEISPESVEDLEAGSETDDVVGGAPKLKLDDECVPPSTHTISKDIEC